MEIYLDNKVEKCLNEECKQLRTPLTQYKAGELPWALDNGAFTEFKERQWLRMLGEAIEDGFFDWFTMPDVVGDHDATLREFWAWKAALNCYFGGVPNLVKDYGLFVLQDGCSHHLVPWNEIKGVFVGGTTRFKYSHKLWEILQVAKIEGKYIHVGRVNTPARIIYFDGLADSIDGSGLAKYSHMLERAKSTIEILSKSRQMRFDEFKEVK